MGWKGKTCIAGWLADLLACPALQQQYIASYYNAQHIYETVLAPCSSSSLEQSIKMPSKEHTSMCNRRMNMMTASLAVATHHHRPFLTRLRPSIVQIDTETNLQRARRIEQGIVRDISPPSASRRETRSHASLYERSLYVVSSH